MELTAEETQRYDRQVRVWGAEAQKRLQTSKVLLCGMSGLNSEVVKNLVLSGVNCVIQDCSVVSPTCLGSNYFLSMEDVGKNCARAALPRIQELNSFAAVGCEEQAICDLPDSYFEAFDVILLSECSENQAIRIDQICRNHGKRSLFWSGVFGVEAWFISDFGDNFEFKNDPPNNKVIQTMKFPALESVLSSRWTGIISRHFPLNGTFVKCRLLSKFRDLHQRSPEDCETDLALMNDLAVQECRDNGVLQLDTLDQSPAAPSSDCPPSSASSSKVSLLPSCIQGPLGLAALCRVACSAPVMTCSVLGSVLAQEVIKAISLTGRPSSNVVVYNGERCEVKAIPVMM